MRDFDVLRLARDTYRNETNGGCTMTEIAIPFRESDLKEKRMEFSELLVGRIYGCHRNDLIMSSTIDIYYAFSFCFTQELHTFNLRNRRKVC